jgi:two-component system, OmpR family, response regulator
MEIADSQRTRRILVVDDDQSIREMITLALEDDGHEVISAPEGESALAMIPEIKPDIILLDNRMPVMDGHEFAERYLSMENRTAALIILTAVDDPAETAARIGADDYLPKPFDLSDLTSVVNRHLGTET